MGLEFDAVTHVYGRKSPALVDINVKLTTGITGLVGENGSGKSTLMRIAAGALAPKEGTARIGPFDIYRRRERSKALRRVAWMPQNTTNPRNISVIDFVSYLTWMRGFSRADAKKRSRQALDDVRLGKVLNERLGKLSGGMTRRVWLAQALAATPEVLLLDEPSTGLDPRQRATMVDLLSQRGAETVLLSSHLLEDVVDLADRVIVLCQGAVVYDGPPPNPDETDWLLRFMPEESHTT